MSLNAMRCWCPQANVVIESFQAVTGNPTRTVDLPGGPSSSPAPPMPPPAAPALAGAPYSGSLPQMSRAPDFQHFAHALTSNYEAETSGIAHLGRWVAAGSTG